MCLYICSFTLWYFYVIYILLPQFYLIYIVANLFVDSYVRGVTEDTGHLRVAHCLQSLLLQAQGPAYLTCDSHPTWAKISVTRFITRLTSLFFLQTQQHDPKRNLKLILLSDIYFQYSALRISRDNISKKDKF
jgi:hypothetical protein